MFQSNSNEPNPATPAEVRSNGDREAVKIMVVGSPRAVIKIIHTLYRLGFAEVTAWSPPIPTAIPGEVMRVLVRRVSVDGNSQSSQ